jgi:hypothetical protein
MKTRTIMLGAAGIGLAVGLMTIAGAQVHDIHGGMGPHGPGGVMAVPQMLAWVVDTAVDGPGVSDAQRSRLLAVKARVMSQAETLHAEHAATHEEFKRQWEAGTMDTAQLHALVDARVEDLRRVLQSAVDGLAEVHETLTPEQRRATIERLQSMHAVN